MHLPVTAHLLSPHGSNFTHFHGANTSLSRSSGPSLNQPERRENIKLLAVSVSTVAHIPRYFMRRSKYYDTYLT